MATTGVFNGTDLVLAVGSSGSEVTIGHTTSCSMSFSHDLPEATTKDSSGWAEFISGVRGATISFDGLVAYDDTTNAEELADYIINRTAISFVFGTAETGDSVYTGTGFIDTVEVSADMEAPVSYSGSITVTGAITKATNA
jgi:predicted secreted protein